MFKRLQNDRGYALFLTMLIIIVFGVLSVMLLTVVVSGANKNVVREQVTQAGELSEKGIEHITNQIHKELDDFINSTSGAGVIKSHFIDKMTEVLDSYLCEPDEGKTSSKIEQLAETGEYVTCIDSWNDSSGEYAELRKEVTFKSIGLVDGKEQVIYTTMLIGANDVPDALNYAVGVHKCEGSNCKKLNGEGNLFLHGASSIEGDIKVDGHLITTNRGYAYLSGERWIGSLYPSALPGKNTNESRLVLGGDVYTFSNKPTYSTHISSNRFSSWSYKKTTNLSEAFENPPILVSRDPKREHVAIEEHSSTYKYGFNDPGVTKFNGQTIQNQNLSGKKVFPYYKTYKTVTNTTFTLSGNNTFGQFATDGSVKIRNSNKNNFNTTTIQNGMYVHGNLYIGDTEIEYNNYNPNDYEKVRVSGPIYVNGNLIIKGADAEFNALIYVNGTVTISNSRINGIIQNGKQGSLIVFANGNIEITNNSVHLDEPSNIRGFFYSEDALEMFGVGSNLRIEGGISARRIVLNAIRGRSQSKRFSGSQKITNSYYFEGVSGQRNRPSRLQVIYNPEIINTYSDLKTQEPVITKLESPELIRRK